MSTVKPKAGGKALRLKTSETALASGMKPSSKKTSILSQSNENLWIASEKLDLEPAKYDLFHNPANKIAFTPLGQLPKAPQPKIVSEELASPKTANKPSSNLPVVSEPAYIAQKSHKVSTARKKVRWGPTIIATGHVIRGKPTKANASIKAAEVKPKDLRIKEAARHTEKEASEILAAIKAIQKWTKDDTAKLKSVVQALKDLGLDDEEKKAEQQFLEPVEDVGVTVSTIKSLDPRVPEFEFSASPKKVIYPGELSQEYIMQKDRSTTTHKENISMQQATISLARQNTTSRRTICDDYHEHGRTVAAFDHWYAEKQLIEFMKKYPMTGKKALVVKKQTMDKHNHHEMVKSGPTSGRHAAMIQQRLEFLLWKAKEKEAMKKAFTAQSDWLRYY